MDREGSYFDVHSHILPGIDDGSANMEETVQMLKTAIDQGIQCIIATPHYALGADNAPVKRLEEVREQVLEEARKLSKDFKLYLGNELFYSESIVEELKEGKALTLAGSRYVLVEFSVKEEYRYIYQGMGQLIRAGYAPVLAHVERYLCLKKKKDRLMELIEQGCYLQMNSSSLIGGLFDTEAAYNRKLFDLGMIHLIGSDSHDSRFRVPKMRSAVDALRKKSDQEHIRKVFQDNPVKIINNIYI
jgi:protein-tyrosine phosphatase